MQIKIYFLHLIFFVVFSHTCIAQELFPKKELYHVWVLAGEDLDNGKFDDALNLYRTHPDDPSFSMKVRQVSRLKEISFEAERLRKRKNYADAVDKYKEYRKLKDIGMIGVFEKKIAECLIEINKGKLTELTAQQRIITGFEWAHRGRQKLSEMDTIGAKRDFNNARILGGNRNNILKEQYVEGNRIVAALTQWGIEKSIFEKSGKSRKEQLAFLQTYRDIRNVDIPTVELEIKEIRSELEGNRTLTNVAKLCDTDLLLSYVNTNQDEIKASASLISRLKDYKSTLNKISLLKQNINNAATVESAYASIISWIGDFPVEIRTDLTECIKIDRFETFNNYALTAKNNADEKSAAKFSKIAKQSIVDFVNDEEIEKPAAINTCKGLENFNKGISLVRRELANCSPVSAKSIWEKNLVYLKGCDDARAILSEKKSLKDSIFLMVRNDSLITAYRKQIQNMLAQGECSKTVKVYEQMRGLRVCRQDLVDDEVEAGLAEAKNCKNNSWWRPELTGSYSSAIPKYIVAGVERRMENGYMATAGAQISFIDHKNPVDFSIGLEYFNTQYSSIGSRGSVLENYSLRGASGNISIKLHQANTNPNKIRPYIKIGTEIIIPLLYEYESFAVFSKVSGTDQLQKTVLSGVGGIGLEIQKEHFSAFIEGFGSYAMANSIYNSSLAHIITAQNQKVEARITRVGVRVGFRLW
jgi:hypothetical protein